MQTCECKLWDKNIDQYNDMFNFVEKYHGPSYEGDDYSFCPWCGTEITKNEEAEDEEWDEEEDDEDEEVIDTTPMHGEEDEDDEDEEDEDEEYELEFEIESPEIISYPVLLEGWLSEN